MMADYRDLWPQSIKVARVSPATILKEQASFLGQKTKNIVIAEVWTRPVDQLDTISAVFVLIAPALDNYKFVLFTMRCKIENLYPVYIHSDTLGIDQTVIENEAELFSALEQIFAHEKTMRVINSMLCQSQPMRKLLNWSRGESFI